jgi:hypothetical protein
MSSSGPESCVSEPAPIQAASSEERYFPTIGALLGPILIPLVILLLGSLWRLRETSAELGAVAAHFLEFVVGTTLYVIVIRALCVVRLSAQGIRGSTRPLTSWKDITEVARNRSLLVAGFHVRSAKKYSIWIHQSVWTNPDFGRRVDALASGSALNRALVTDRALARAAQAQDRGDI